MSCSQPTATGRIGIATSRCTPPSKCGPVRDRYIPQQRRLNPDETYDALITYRRRYGPRLARFLRYMGYPYSGKDEELRAVAGQAHAVGFRPRDGGEVG